MGACQENSCISVKEEKMEGKDKRTSKNEIKGSHTPNTDSALMHTEFLSTPTPYDPGPKKGTMKQNNRRLDRQKTKRKPWLSSPLFRKQTTLQMAAILSAFLVFFPPFPLLLVTLSEWEGGIGSPARTRWRIGRRGDTRQDYA